MNDLISYVLVIFKYKGILTSYKNLIISHHLYHYKLSYRREKDKVCGKIAAYPKENCHPDIYQCVGKHMCLKPQIVKDQIPNASSNRRRPCLRFRGFPKALRRCRIRNGLVRQKRETTENNYGRSILHIQKVKSNNIDNHKKL